MFEMFEIFVLQDTVAWELNVTTEA